jgi:hypothetical protein
LENHRSVVIIVGRRYPDRSCSFWLPQGLFTLGGQVLGADGVPCVCDNSHCYILLLIDLYVIISRSFDKTH